MIFEWDIPNFFYRIHEEYIISEYFTCGQFQFKVQLYPRGQDKNNHMSIFLQIDDKNMSDDYRIIVSSRFVFLARSVKEKFSSSSNRSQQFSSNIYTKSHSVWGYLKYIPLRDIGKYMYGPNNILRIRVKVHVEDATDTMNPSLEKTNYKMCDDKMSCPICCERYVNPKSLQCGHSFCESCTSSMVKNNTVSCPFCRKLTPSNCIVSNYMLQDILDSNATSN